MTTDWFINTMINVRHAAGRFSNESDVGELLLMKHSYTWRDGRCWLASSCLETLGMMSDMITNEGCNEVVAVIIAL